MQYTAGIHICNIRPGYTYAIYGRDTHMQDTAGIHICRPRARFTKICANPTLHFRAAFAKSSFLASGLEARQQQIGETCTHKHTYNFVHLSARYSASFVVKRTSNYPRALGVRMRRHTKAEMNTTERYDL